MNAPPPLSQDETINLLLQRSGRASVPIRRAFLEVRDEKGGTYPGRLSAIVKRHDERALELFLVAHAVTSSDKQSGGFDVTEWSQTWARTLGLYGDASGMSAVSRVWRRLEKDRLIARSRGPKRRTKITILQEDGSGNAYSFPSGGRQHAYFRLAYEYWTDEWYKKLSLPAKAVLLMSLSRDRHFYLPHDQAADWYGVSRDTIRDGLHLLQRRGLLATVETRYIPSLASPTGWTPRTYYELRSPFSKTDEQPEAGQSESQLAS